jgi:hypothetical protein
MMLARLIRYPALFADIKTATVNGHYIYPFGQINRYFQAHVQLKITWPHSTFSELRT